MDSSKTTAVRGAMAILALLLSLALREAAAQQAAGEPTPPMMRWARGVVRDETGRPVAGATVFARATYHGGLRMYGLFHSAQTDAEGRYEILGEHTLSSFSAALVAHAPGRPPAFAWLQAVNDGEWREGNDRILPGGDVDFALPAAGAELEVLVSRGGQPAAGATVALRLEGLDPFDHWGLELRTAEHDRLRSICRPSRRTDARGRAQFTGLVPGLYSVFAVEGDEQAALTLTEYHRWFPFGDEPICGEAQHVPVRIGAANVHRLAMFRHGCVTRFEVLKDGRDWIAEQRLHPNTCGPDGEFQSTPTWIGKEWTDTFRFETAGLKQLSFERYTGISSFPRRFPFDAAPTTVASSPRLSRGNPVKTVAAKSHGGSLRVQIKDEGGRPLAGSARFTHHSWASPAFHDVAPEGSRITGFEPGSGIVEAKAAGLERRVPNEDLKDIPPDDQLQNRLAILPQRASIANNDEAALTFVPEKVGYVRGKLVLPAGQTNDDLQLVLGRADYDAGARLLYLPKTGEFLAGPYRTGEAHFYILSRGFPAAFLKSVAVTAGSVAAAELVLSKDFEIGTGRRHLGGSVVLADGSTPARYAAVARYSPGDEYAWQFGTTDSRGVIQPRGSAYRTDIAYLDSDSPQNPRQAVLLAWLRGSTGAAIVPLAAGNAALPIRLPPATSLRGRITVEGDGDVVANGTLTVRAQYEGRGVLNDLLSIETTAGADGSFELAGLTPGVYRVQAALDRVWLSSSLQIAVTERGAASPDSVRLAIPPPGGPAVVQLTGAWERSVQRLTVDRPSGPLTDRCWPKVFLPDGAGLFRIPALESGRHSIHVNGRPHTVDVPTLAQSGGRPEEVVVAVQAP